ncbi:PREDICTED: iron-sulfur protein NUBPL [Ceratosolen solmsi marchali]|uniref:Iron-sulfur protein NUBPL n=1 Tax=Ceratosolen solmsi marchali TaxID=326594 RepID=A0AAJ7DY15_9HYME|nr:PREDICTED: iron-sulfur protein NUBPL [Ceratosolen solmsi marchali]
MSFSRKIIIEKYFQQYFKRYCSSLKSTKTKTDELKERQKEMMARSLPKQMPITGVKQILIVASGKGGVGKSTTSVNLAVALKLLEPKKSVGLLDADVFGPSIPLMMNLHETPLLNKNNFMEPLLNYGIKCMSMGFLIDEKSPVVWRGLMVMSALNKLMRQVSWGLLDYLIIDTPPGTGDTHLSLIQNLPISGALLVTTPQKAAVNVTKRGAALYSKINVPLAGIVSNMSNIVCPNCKSEIPLLKDEISNLAQEFGIQILCKIPLDEDIAEGCDNGKPIVINDPNSNITTAYKTLAKDVSKFLRNQPVNTC